MNFKKRVNGSWTDTPHYIHKTDTDILTTLPADIYANDTTATVGLKGNMEQASGVSPTTPIQPSECGERTGNLWDEEYPDISGTIRYIPLYVGEGSFTLSTTTPYDSSVGVANIFLLSGNVSSGASSTGNGAWLNHNVTAQSVDGYITIAYRHYSSTTSPVDCQAMLNTGLTALPYEPYGYKIPISSGGVTTPVYLCEVQTTRRIKKLVLTGEENWTLYNNNYFSTITDSNSKDSNVCVCSHLISSPSAGIYIGSGTARLKVFSRDVSSVSSDLDTFKTWLAMQYANGTPVTIWYVLATETTGVLNEPLRKIGDYSDSVSVSNIPTTGTAESFDIDTTLKPSEVQLTYHGWHEHSDTMFTE